MSASILIFVLFGCKTMWNYDSSISYDNVREDMVFMGDFGDFERINFIDDEDLLAMCWYNDLRSEHGQNIQVLLRVSKASGFNFLTNEIHVVSKKQGPFEAVSAKVGEIDFRKDLNHLSREEVMNAIRNDTLIVTLAGKTYRFASRLAAY